MDIKLKREKLNADDCDRNEITPIVTNIRIKPVYQSLHHPQEFVRLCGEGCLLSEIAATFGISVKTLSKWSTEHTDFAEAVDLGYTVSRAFWERLARENLFNRDFQVGLWATVMQNKFAWSKKLEGARESIDGGNKGDEDVRTIDLTPDFRLEIAKLMIDTGLLPQPTAQASDV
jgi:hypothetical protein